MKARQGMRWVLPAAVVAMVMASASVGLAARPPYEAMSTGVGVTERFAHPDYSLLMTFARASGPYLANIEVQIRDQKGQVIFADPAAGPWLFAKLPPGDYNVVATQPNGRETGAAFSINGGRQESVHLTW
ncbi:MAG TPA: hypothetical protein VF678_01560 [bacterium]